MVIQPLKLPNEVSEWACSNANGLAFLQIKAELNVAVSIGEDRADSPPRRGGLAAVLLLA